MVKEMKRNIENRTETIMIIALIFLISTVFLSFIVSSSDSSSINDCTVPNTKQINFLGLSKIEKAAIHGFSYTIPIPHFYHIWVMEESNLQTNNNIDGRELEINIAGSNKLIQN